MVAPRAAQESPASMVIHPSLYASRLDARGRKETSMLTTKGPQSPSGLGICLARLSRTSSFVLDPEPRALPAFRNPNLEYVVVPRFRPARRNPGYVVC